MYGIYGRTPKKVSPTKLKEGTMARTARETANILAKLIYHEFCQDLAEPYRITWPQLRSLAAVSRLNDSFLKEINTVLSEFGKTIVPLDNSLLIARDDDFEHYRMVPDRLLEEYLPNGSTDSLDGRDQEIEDDEI
jgi:hypothetical protein